jgi:hypothetical protein
VGRQSAKDVKELRIGATPKNGFLLPEPVIWRGLPRLAGIPAARDSPVLRHRSPAAKGVARWAALWAGVVMVLLIRSRADAGGSFGGSPTILMTSPTLEA